MSGELNENLVAEKNSATAADGKNYLMKFYNLDSSVCSFFAHTGDMNFYNATAHTFLNQSSFLPLNSAKDRLAWFTSSGSNS